MDYSSKKGVFSKMWGRCVTVSDQKKLKGCFPIQVGPERERFVIKTAQVNHPLFKILLQEAEFEYGYANNPNGPLMLPCDVDHFVAVLIQMDGCDEPKGCNSSFHFHTPPRVIALSLPG